MMLAAFPQSFVWFVRAARQAQARSFIHSSKWGLKTRCRIVGLRSGRKLAMSYWTSPWLLINWDFGIRTMLSSTLLECCHHHMVEASCCENWASFARLLILLCLIACKRRSAILSTYLSSASAEVTHTAMADPLHEPALETPPGVISQFPTTHSDEQAWYYVCAVLSTVVPGTLLLLRLYTKLRILRKMDVTDCSIPLSRFVAPILTKI